MDASQKRPTAGVRYAIERASEDETGVVVYRGFAHVPDADLPLVVRVEHDSASGTEGRSNVVAKLDESVAIADVSAIEKAAAALVKAAARAARDAGRPLPRRIVRWRGP
jgi:hypothetical protein